MKPTCLLLSFLICAISSTDAAELKVLKVGTNPESVCRGFDDKLYVTMIMTVIGNADKEVLVMGDFFPGNIVSYDGESFKILATGMRGADGVEFGEGVIYVSSWPLGKVWKFDRKTKETTILSEDFTTAADFFFDRRNKQLIVPDMVEGTLTFLPLE